MNDAPSRLYERLNAYKPFGLKIGIADGPPEYLTVAGIKLRFGYMETPNIPRALGAARKLGLHFDNVDVVFSLAPRAAAGATFGHSALAGPSVHHACPFGQRCDRLFPDSD